MNALLGSRYEEEISERAMERARRRMAERNRDPEPEKVTPVRIGGMVVFLLASFGAVIYALAILGEAIRV